FWSENGYVPPGALIDSCSAAEGPCYSGPTGIVPTDQGTIMSYCDQLGGVEKNIRLAFHPICAARMRAVVQASCMPAATVAPPTSLTATAAGGSAHLSWSPSTASGVLRYEVLRSSWTPDLAPSVVGSTAGTSFDDPVPWSTFYYRVRAVRASDTS